VIETDEMVGKIRSAVAARSTDEFMIIARTDAIAVEGIEGAVERAKAYEAAGADAIFPDAVRGRQDIERIVAAVKVPVRINMGFGIRTRATTPLMSIPSLRALGVRWVSLSRMLPAAAIRGMSQALKVMREAMEEESIIERPDLVADMSTITDLMGYAEYLDIERRFLSEDQIEKKYRNGGALS
jgi:2-methylisocitrate lyase-like PEP mutase family enzyme